MRVQNFYPAVDAEFFHSVVLSSFIVHRRFMCTCGASIHMLLKRLWNNIAFPVILFLIRHTLGGEYGHIYIQNDNARGRAGYTGESNSISIVHFILFTTKAPRWDDWSGSVKGKRAFDRILKRRDQPVRGFRNIDVHGKNIAHAWIILHFYKFQIIFFSKNNSTLVWVIFINI